MSFFFFNNPAQVQMAKVYSRGKASQFPPPHTPPSTHAARGQLYYTCLKQGLTILIQSALLVDYTGNIFYNNLLSVIAGGSIQVIKYK